MATPKGKMFRLCRPREEAARMSLASRSANCGHHIRYSKAVEVYLYLISLRSHNSTHTPAGLSPVQKKMKKRRKKKRRRRRRRKRLFG